MALTINERAILSGTVRLPLSGRWTADLRVVGDRPIAGAVTLDLDGAAYSGFAMRSDTHAGETHCRVVGGAGGLATALPERWYRGSPTVARIVEDLLRETGEALSVASDDVLLGQVLPAYRRAAGPGGPALRALLDLYGARWRVVADGSVRVVAAESWPTTEPPHAFLEANRAEGWELVALAGELALAPGVTFRGRQVRYVEHELSAAQTRTRVYETDPRSLLDRAEQNSGVDFARLWPGSVERQNADGSVDVIVQAYGETWGLTAVPVTSSLPGARARLAGGEGVLVGFEAGDPRRPYVAGFATGGSARWGTLLIVIAGPAAPVPGIVISAQFFEASQAGDLALTAAKVAAVPNIPLEVPLETSEVQSG